MSIMEERITLTETRLSAVTAMLRGINTNGGKSTGQSRESHDIDDAEVIEVGQYDDQEDDDYDESESYNEELIEEEEAYDEANEEYDD